MVKVGCKEEFAPYCIYSPVAVEVLDMEDGFHCCTGTVHAEDFAPQMGYITTTDFGCIGHL